VIFHLSEGRGGGTVEDTSGKDGASLSSRPLEAFVLFSCAEEAAALLPAVQSLASS
jgi:hypothetical protein